MNEALSAQMLRASEQLAASIEAGEFDALSVEQRFQLRWLALGIHTWSDLVETREQKPATAPRQKRTWRQKAWVVLRAVDLVLSVIGLAVAVALLKALR